MSIPMLILQESVTGIDVVQDVTPLRSYLNPGNSHRIAIHGSIITSIDANVAGSSLLNLYRGGQGESTLFDTRHSRFSAGNEEKNILPLRIPGYILLDVGEPLEAAFEVSGSGEFGDSTITTYYSLVPSDPKADPTAAAVTSIAATTATFNGTITPNTKGPVTWIFQRATDATFDTGLTDTGGGTIAAGHDPLTSVTISEGETGLVTATTYYVRLKVTEGGATIYSENVNFTTA